MASGHDGNVGHGTRTNKRKAFFGTLEIDPIIIDFNINAIRKKKKKKSFFCLFCIIYCDVVPFEGGERAETMMRNNNKMS